MKEREIKLHQDQNLQSEEETKLLLLDKKGKLEQDYEWKQKKLKTKLILKQEIERQKLEKAKLEEESRFLNQKEFAINKEILNEISN